MWPPLQALGISRKRIIDRYTFLSFNFTTFSNDSRKKEAANIYTLKFAQY